MSYYCDIGLTDFKRKSIHSHLKPTSHLKPKSHKEFEKYKHIILLILSLKKC